MNETWALLIDRGAAVSFAGAAVALLFVAFSGFRRWSPRETKNGKPVPFPLHVGIFVVFVVLTLTLSQILVIHGRNAVLATLASASPGIRVNADTLANPQALLDALREIQGTAAHHSHATHRITVEIQSAAGSAQLELGRDSSRSDEYWVFLPKYWATSTRELGRIHTAALSAY